MRSDQSIGHPPKYMNPQEERLFAKLYNQMQQWFEENSLDWQNHSLAFKKMYKLFKLHHQTFRVLLDDTTPLTIEEKVANAVFYVDQEGRHSISNRRMLNRSFIIFNEHQGKYITIQFDSIPADAYFLATVRL